MYSNLFSPQYPYLNQYFGQGMCGYGSGCCSSGNPWTMMGAQLGFTLVEGLVGRMLGGGGSCFGGLGTVDYGYGLGRGYNPATGTGGSQSAKSRDQQISDLEAKINSADSEVNKTKPQLANNITAAQTELETYTSLKKNYDAKKAAFGALEEPKPLKDNASEEEKQQYNTEFANYKKAKEELENAKEALIKAGYDNPDEDQTEALKAKIEEAKEAKNKAVEAYKAEIQKQLDELKATPPMSCSDMNDLLNEADGNWIERKFTGTRGDMMKAIRKFRKAKQEYDSIPNTKTNTKAKAEKKEELIKLAGHLDNIYNNASDKDREEIISDRTLQMGWNAVKDWTKYING